MTDSLPASLREIIDVERSNPAATRRPAIHSIGFVSADGSDLAAFIAEGAMLIPSEGKRIHVHGVPVIVVDVDVAYETTDDGSPAVYASVVVKPAE